jgi:2-keto-3-deoxy-L-rhamnonate aldolase RhmA
MSLNFVAREAQAQRHFNPVIDVLEAGKPVFGLYAPTNRRGGRGAPALPADSVKTPLMLAREALSNKTADFIFDGSMEGNLEAALPAYAGYMKALSTAGFVSKSGSPHLTHPMYIKTHEIAEDYAKAQVDIAKQLNEGASNVTFVGVESADEVTKGLGMMRFKSKGGVRPDAVGNAPSIWGMTEAQYKEKADVWPLNPRGELVNFTIVESKEGLEHIREIAAVKGIGVLFPGAGTLRGVFSSPPDAQGKRVFDEKGWEDAIQLVLAACKEFHVPCGYPSTEKDIETRMQQGFSVFIMNWGDAGFRAVDIGRKAAGRPPTNTTNN